MSEDLINKSIRPLATRTKVFYGTGDFASNLVWGTVTTYLMFFYTDVFHLNIAFIGTLFFVARLIDAIMDPVMGVICDKTRTKWGRFRPYILFMPILLAVLNVLCFSVPNASDTLKTIYAFATYILLGVSYSAVNIPYGAMIPTMTQDTDERSNLASFRSAFALLGTLAVSVATLPLVKAIGGTDSSSKGFVLTAAMYSVIILPIFYLVFRNTKEVVPAPERVKLKLKDLLKVVFGNKPLVLLMISSLLFCTSFFTRQSVTIYYFSYVSGNENLTSVFLGVSSLVLLVGVAFAAPLSARLGSKKNTMVLGFAVPAVTFVAMFFANPQNITVLLILAIIGSAFLGLVFVMLWSMIADTIEYAEWKTGIRADGVIYSSASFMQKLASAISGWLIAFTLSAVGYIPNVVQSNGAKSGINIMMSLGPGIIMLVSLIPLFYYDLDRKKFNSIMDELRARTH